jgi:hypothetical protein
MSVSAMRSRSAIAEDSSINFEELLQKLDEEFAELSPAVVDRFRFEYDGLNFDVRRVAREHGHSFLINATLGYLPFSIESNNRREAIKSIVMASRSLPNVHFLIDYSSKILAGALFDVEELVSPDFIFYPLMLFLQEARPFVQLIGTYLTEAS